MERIGEITAMDGDVAEVTFCREKDCGQCHACEGGEKRTVLRLPAKLAPNKVAVLPLVKKDGLPEIGQEVFDMLKKDFMVQYEDKDAIGRRYRRQDAIGTPFCVTIDNQTKEDQTVTVRERDTMAQYRLPIADLTVELMKKLR